MMLNEYTVNFAGWINGPWRDVGDTVTMSENEAKYLEMSGQLSKVVVKEEPVKEDTQTIDKDANVRTKSNRRAKS